MRLPQPRFLHRNVQRSTATPFRPPQPRIIHRNLVSFTATSNFPPQPEKIHRNLEPFTATRSRSPQPGAVYRKLPPLHHNFKRAGVFPSLILPPDSVRRNLNPSALDRNDRSCYYFFVAKGEETRQEIVEQALRLANEVGLEGLSLGVLAASMGLSKSGLFAHFRSKEALQLEVLQRAIDHFIRDVVMPALQQARGEARVKMLFDRYLAWIRGENSRGSCFFMALTHEYDDRPGPVRDLLVQSQRDWYGTIARAAHIAVEEGHFRADLDVDQFAYELVGIGMAFQQTHKLLEDPRAEERSRGAFSALVARSRA